MAISCVVGSAVGRIVMTWRTTAPTKTGTSAEVANRKAPSWLQRFSAEEGPLTLEQTARRLTLTHQEASRAAGRLIVRGYVDRLERGVYEATVEGLRAKREGRDLASGPRRPHAGQRRAMRDTLRQRAWTAMRVLKRFTVADLAVASRKRGEGDPSHNLGAYLRALSAADIVVELPVRADDGVPTSNGLKVYRLLRDTGATAPQWRQARRQVFVHDTRELIPCRSSTN